MCMHICICMCIYIYAINVEQRRRILTYQYIYPLSHKLDPLFLLALYLFLALSSTYIKGSIDHGAMFFSIRQLDVFCKRAPYSRMNRGLEMKLEAESVAMGWQQLVAALNCQISFG